MGISCFYHDSAAALIKDGTLIAAASEERFPPRKKHTHDFPIESVKFCLQYAGIDIKDVDYIAFYEKPFKKFERILTTYIKTFPRSFLAFAKAVPLWVTEKLYVESIIRKTLGYEGKIVFSDHHLSHACSSFLVSPFDKAAILTVDGVGEWSTTTWGEGEGNKITVHKEIRFPHSLGLFYSAVTGYLGFKVNDGEGKIMGLAPYGKPRYMEQMNQLIDVKEDGSFQLNMKYFSHHYSPYTMINKRFLELFSQPPRVPESEMTEYYQDVAASLQKKLEDTMVAMSRSLYEKVKIPNLCIAGGVGLNSVANWEIRKQTPFKNLFIQPAAGDDGGALGAAFFVWNILLDKPRTFRFDHALWGPEYTNDQIKAMLDKNKARYRYYDNDALLKKTAQLIAENHVIGWFQGRMELGPRALGSRSILGNAMNPAMKDILNRKVKHREGFRPFAPAVPIEDYTTYFDMDCPSPYMLLIGDVHKNKRDVIPAVTHVDGTARVQTLDKDNGMYYELAKEVGRLTGCSVIIDTSFNIAGEPIVCSPEDAYKCYYTTGIDYLVMGNYITESKTPEEVAMADRIERERAEKREKKLAEDRAYFLRMQQSWWRRMMPWANSVGTVKE